MFVYKLFDKIEKFQFFRFFMPHVSSNIASSIFYGSIFSVFLRIARCTLRLTDFIPRASELHLTMVAEGGKKDKID